MFIGAPSTIYDVQFTYFLRMYSHVLISGFLCLLFIHPSQLLKLGLQPGNIVYCISLDPDLIKPQLPGSGFDETKAFELPGSGSNGTTAFELS